jgi:hypothetical protein
VKTKERITIIPWTANFKGRLELWKDGILGLNGKINLLDFKQSIIPVFQHSIIPFIY